MAIPFTFIDTIEPLFIEIPKWEEDQSNASLSTLHFVNSTQKYFASYASCNMFGTQFSPSEQTNASCRASSCVCAWGQQFHNFNNQCISKQLTTKRNREKVFQISVFAWCVHQSPLQQIWLGGRLPWHFHINPDTQMTKPMLVVYESDSLVCTNLSSNWPRKL